MIEIKGLNKYFGSKKIFSNFCCNIQDKKMTALVGPSGSGKSTLLNMIGLLDNNYEGKIIYNGEIICHKNQKEKVKFIRNHINYLFQNYALIEDDTVENNLLLALEYEKLSKLEKKKKIREKLSLVGIEGLELRKIYTLSGGEQQRVALARILLKKGDIILADEPTGNLDKKNGDIIINLLQKLKAEDKTIIIVTHDEAIASQCDDVIHL